MIKFKPGQRYREDFDYCGMVKAGSKAKLKSNKNILDKLFDSYEDVNYHKESEPLLNTLKNLKDAEDSLKHFNQESKKLFKEMGC